MINLNRIENWNSSVVKPSLEQVEASNEGLLAEYKNWNLKSNDIRLGELTRFERVCFKSNYFSVKRDGKDAGKILLKYAPVEYKGENKNWMESRFPHLHPALVWAQKTGRVWLNQNSLANPVLLTWEECLNLIPDCPVKFAYIDTRPIYPWISVRGYLVGYHEGGFQGATLSSNRHLVSVQNGQKDAEVNLLVRPHQVFLFLRAYQEM